MIATVADLKSRFYEILGDNPDTPRLVPWTDVLSLFNDGATMMRGLCSDVLGRDYVAVTAGQSLYSFPDACIRLIRVAYANRTLWELSGKELDALDFSWQTRNGRPDYYTTDGFKFNEFWLYKTPEVTSSDFVQVNGNFGIVVTATGDIAINSNFGEVQTAVLRSVTPNYGTIVGAQEGFDDRIQLWFVRKAEPMLGESSLVPLVRPDRIGVLWYALWKIYASESDLHNAILEGLYREMFYKAAARCLKRASNPLPGKLDVLRGDSETTRPARRLPFSDRMTPPGGNPVDLIW